MKYRPMLARIGDKEDLNRENFIYEPKIDGFRALCFVNKGLKFLSRNNLDMTDNYPELQFRKNIKAKTCVLDGELVVYDKKGIPNFNLMQKRNRLTDQELITERSKAIPVTYIVFDILMKNGKSLLKLPLLERKKILKETIKPSKRLELIPYSDDGKKLWKEVKKIGLEGVMAKEDDGIYLSGERSRTWLKVKLTKTMDCIVIGYTHGKRIISSLALGIYDKGKLIYIGKVGTGFSIEFLEKLYKKLQKLKLTKPPVTNEIPRGIQWIKPKLVAEIKYFEFTKTGHLRKPVFLHLRTDKKPKQCTLKSQL